MNRIYILVSLLSSLLFFSSCDKKSLSEKEKETVQNFLTYQWYDLSFTKFGDDIVINDTRLIFSKKGQDLEYVWDMGYNAIFGSQTYQNKGKVDLYYSKEKNSIVISLLDEKDKASGFEALIEVEKDSIIPQLSKQIEYRKHLKDFLKGEKVKYLLSNRDIRGLFQSVLDGGEVLDNYEELENFTPLTIKGLYTQFKNTIEWEMKEAYLPEPKDFEIDYDDLKSEFTNAEALEIKNLLQGPLKYYDSNIKSKNKFNKEGYTMQLEPELSYNNNTNRYELSISEHNYDFILNAPAKMDRFYLVFNHDPEGDSYNSISIYLRVDGMIRYPNGNGRTVTHNFQLLKDKTNKNRLYLFDNFKYYILEK